MPLIKRFSNMRNIAFNFPVRSCILKLALINQLFIWCHRSQVQEDFLMLLELSLSICVVDRPLPAMNHKRAAPQMLGTGTDLMMETSSSWWGWDTLHQLRVRREWSTFLGLAFWTRSALFSQNFLASPYFLLPSKRNFKNPKLPE